MEGYTTKTEKMMMFLKSQMTTIILIGLCIFYILKGITEIEYGKKTIQEIVADGLLAFFVGISIKYLLRQKGFATGYTAPKFIAACNIYGEKIGSISPHVHELDYFCEFKNKETLKIAQTRYLVSKGMSYIKFNNGEYDLEENKERKKYVNNARKMKVYKYSSVTLTNAYDTTNGSEAKLLNIDKKSYNSKKTINNILKGSIISFAFAYYSLSKGVVDISNIIWAGIQIIMFLLLGMIEYATAFEFITETYRAKIKRTIVLLDEFENLRKINPKIFMKENTINYDESI